MTQAPCQLVVVMGVCGSGKTTVGRLLAELLRYRFVDADDFHSAQAKARLAASQPLDDATREPWVDAVADDLRQHGQQQLGQVLAFSGLRTAHRQRLRGLGLHTLFIYLNGSNTLIEQRLTQRLDHFMPIDLLASQFAAMQPTDSESDVVELAIDQTSEQIAAAAHALCQQHRTAPRNEFQTE